MGGNRYGIEPPPWHGAHPKRTSDTLSVKAGYGWKAGLESGWE